LGEFAVFGVGLSGFEAVVELAEEAVEEVALGGCVPVAVCSSVLVVGLGSG
jgi:hypothetical protein